MYIYVYIHLFIYVFPFFFICLFVYVYIRIYIMYKFLYIYKYIYICNIDLFFDAFDYCCVYTDMAKYLDPNSYVSRERFGLLSEGGVVFFVHFCG